MSKRDVQVAYSRFEEWHRVACRRWVDWAFTDWSSPEFSDVLDYRKADRWIVTPDRAHGLEQAGR